MIAFACCLFLVTRGVNESMARGIAESRTVSQTVDVITFVKTKKWKCEWQIKSRQH